MKHFDVAAASDRPRRRSVRVVMALVLLALLPGIIASTVCFGPGVPLQIALATIFALGLEASMLALRGRPLQPFISDFSAPVTAVLFALCLPPLTPWWIAAIGMAAAIVVAKHLFGGLGHNLFNPAMVGYAVVLVCFPRDLGHWLPASGFHSEFATPGLLDSAKAVLSGQLPTPWAWDSLHNPSMQGMLLEPLQQETASVQFGSQSRVWIASFYGLGGLFLVWKKIIPWQTPVFVLSTTFLLSLPLWLLQPALQLSPLSQVFSSGVMLAAFFIATDPVTGCITPRGRIIFAAGVAALTLAIGQWSVSPGGMAFAVLLMNSAAPLIDSQTRPPFLGEGSAHE